MLQRAGKRPPASEAPWKLRFEAADPQIFGLPGSTNKREED